MFIVILLLILHLLTTTSIVAMRKEIKLYSCRNKNEIITNFSAVSINMLLLIQNNEKINKKNIEKNVSYNDDMTKFWEQLHRPRTFILQKAKKKMSRHFRNDVKQIKIPVSIYKVAEKEIRFYYLFSCCILSSTSI